MNREEILYLLPYLISLIVTSGVFIYTWGHRHVRGARAYSWFVGGQMITILGFILELISPNLQTKILWDKLQWMTGTYLVILPFLIFSVRFSEHKLRHPNLAWGTWIIPTVLFTLVLLSDNVLHLIYPDPGLSTDQPFPDLVYSYTPIVYAYSALFVYGANFWGIGILIKRAIQPYNPHRFQFWAVAVGFLIPVFLSFFALANVKIAPQRDISPFSFAIGNVIVSWGLFRFGLFNIVPIAREHIVENIGDPVLVLDSHNRVVDVNPAALKLLEKQLPGVIRHAAGEVFAKWPAIADELESPDMERKEIAVKDENDIFYFDLNISPVYTKNQQLLGRIIVARDVTRHKTLEAGYRTLSAELEQRVNERTEEAKKVAERYRAVVENQEEFIVRWKPDGGRTFVNEAYCRYFNITEEEALSNSFLPLVAKEDRQAVRDKISRLTSGTVRTETEIHRVIKPDGSIGWQEWTDQAILDESGNLIEFQSVGRDVTRQKQAEQIILRELDFDTLMTRLLTDFATSSSNEVDASIDKALMDIAEFFGGDFADILLLSEDRSTWTSTHYWMSPGLELSIQPSTIIQVGSLKWSEEKLVKGESIRINSPDDYPPEAESERVFSEEEGVKSLISVPIRGNEESVFGVLDIVSYNRQITWSDSDITHLRIMGDAIVNTLERKRAEIAMQISEMKHRLLFESANDSIFIMKENIFIDCNSRALEMFGCERDEIVGKTPVDFSPDRQSDGQTSEDKTRKKIDAVLNGEPQFYEWKHCRRDRTPFDAEVSLSLLKLDDETLIQAIVRDVTERKQAEEALRKSEERFSKAFQSSPIIITISRIDNAELLEVNETFEKVSGYKREEAIGKTTLELGLWENSIDREKLLTTLLEVGELRRREIKFRTKEGMSITGLVSIELIELGGIQCSISVIEDITERKRAEENLAEAYETTLEGWAKALELKDKETEGHSRRVTETTIAVARAMEIPEDEIDHIRRGSILHDIGKMGIPDEILRKSGPLTEEEREVVLKHPTTAYELLKPIPYLEKALDIPYCHHEKWDGSGYPRGLKGKEIPLSARIFALVDVWDALSTNRPYRDAWPQDKVVRYLEDEAGKHFDPQVLELFLQMVNKGEI